MPLSLAAASLLGSGIGAVSSAFGQSRANRENRAEAQRNRDFQERMSNTAMQRAAKDAEKAGLNRILAMTKPSSSPGGSMATIGNIGAAGSEGAAKGASTALQVQQIKNLKAQEILTTNQARAIEPAATVGKQLGSTITSAKDLIGRAKEQFRIGSERRRGPIRAVPRTFPYNPPTSGKGQHFKRNEIGVQELTHNEVGLRAVVAYDKQHPNASKAELERIYKAAVKKSKGK